MCCDTDNSPTTTLSLLHVSWSATELLFNQHVTTFIRAQAGNSKRRRRHITVRSKTNTTLQTSTVRTGFQKNILEFLQTLAQVR